MDFFVNFFIINYLPCTVYSKCHSLTVICRHARLRLSSTPQADVKLSELLLFLDSTFNEVSCATKSKKNPFLF